MMLNQKALDALLSAHDEAWKKSENRLLARIAELETENATQKERIAELECLADSFMRGADAQTQGLLQRISELKEETSEPKKAEKLTR